MMDKMAFIGLTDNVLAFKTCGIEGYKVSNKEKAIAKINSIIDYKIIFLTDDVAHLIDDYLEKHSMETYPIFITVPENEDSLSYGKQLIDKNMQRALGIDILNNLEDE